MLYFTSLLPKDVFQIDIKSWNFRNQFWLPFPSAKWKKELTCKRRATDRMVGLLLVGLCVLLRLLGERASDRDTRSEESASEESQLRNSTASGDLPLIAFRSILVTLCTPFVEGKLPLGLSCTLPGVIIPGTRVGTVISGWSLCGRDPIVSAGTRVVLNGSGIEPARLQDLGSEKSLTERYLHVQSYSLSTYVCRAVVKVLEL